MANDSPAAVLKKALETCLTEAERTDPALAAELRARLRAQRKRPPTDATRIHLEAISEAERKREDEQALIAHVGGGDFERGLEIVERHRREAEQRRRAKEADAERQRRISEAEEKLQQRDRRLARAIRRGESTADL